MKAKWGESMKQIKKRIIAFMCILSLLVSAFSMFSLNTGADAAAKTLTIIQARRLALAKSKSYQKIKSKISAKEVAYDAAVKSAKLIRKNLSTFRWSPLLNFTFPTSANFDQEQEMVVKPMLIQGEISSLRHDLTDEVYEVYSKANEAYIECYMLQEKIRFNEERLTNNKETLEREKIKLVTGDAKQADIDKLSSAIEALESKLTGDKRSFESAKEELSDQIGIDVTVNYRFRTPFDDTQLKREKLQEFIDYTLEHDQQVFEARQKEQSARIQLDTNLNLLNQHYGKDMNLISNYIKQIKAGVDVDVSEFKSAYKKFLEKIDSYWAGKIRIIFFKFSKEWFKGAMDGTRYLADSPYGIYENAVELKEAISEREDIEKQVTKSVKTGFDNLVTLRTAYISLNEQVEKANADMQADYLRNHMGTLPMDEYLETQTNYEDLQQDALDALGDYTKQLTEYERLTCGAITKYLKGGDLSLNSGEDGSSYVDAEIVDGVQYYIKSLVESNLFEFGIYVPEDVELEATEYELWLGGRQIGTRTKLDKTIRHLTFTTYALEKDQAYVRFYNEGEFVDECPFDPMEYSGTLSIVVNYVPKEEKQQVKIGTYQTDTNETTGVVTITPDFLPEEQVSSYRIEYMETSKDVYTSDPVDAKKPFTYLSFILNDMEQLKVHCLDKDGKEKYEAYFDPKLMEIYRLEKLEKVEGDPE